MAHLQLIDLLIDHFTNSPQFLPQTQLRYGCDVYEYTVARFTRFPWNSCKLYQSELVLRKTYSFPIEDTKQETHSEADRVNVHFVAIIHGHPDDTDSVIGCVQYDPSSNRLRQMVVDPAYQSQGIGSKLVDLCKLEAIQNGHDTLRVTASHKAIAYFRSKGFVAVDTANSSKEIMYQCMECKLTTTL